MGNLVSLTKDGPTGLITIDNPPVNALSPGVPEGITAAIDSAQKDASIKAIVLLGAGRTFIAGADIREFGKVTSGEKERGEGFLPLMRFVEDCSKPVVAAIHGTALGGGLELAMACHYRVAVPSALLGQPEVRLGIIPGAGGTQRLPRLIGLPGAAEMCATGKPITAPEAHKRGLIDQVIDGDLQEGAMAFVRGLIDRGATPRRTRELTDPLATVSADLPALDALRERIRKRSRGATAPLRAIDAVEAAASLSFDDGIRREAEIFKECLFSDQSKALIHVFFAERAVKKIPDVPPETAQLEIKKAAVVGAGTMGVGIAMAYASAGIPVILKEVAQERLDQGLAAIRHNFEISQKKGKLTQQDVETRMRLIQPRLSYEDFSSADIVIEAVFEEMDVKKKVFSELSAACRQQTLLVSNTSSLDIDALAAATDRPEMVMGHHFFSPANVMRLLEIVRGKESSREVIATSMALAKRLGKVAVLVGNCPGFVGNRMFGPYMREAQFLVEEGARLEEVDAVLREFGMAMGPLAVGDLAGLDVGWRIRKQHQHLVPEGMRPVRLADRLCELGRYGQKTGKGWYRYEEGSRKPLPDPEVESLIVECAREAGIERREISPNEIVERTVYALVNEGARILEEGFALRSADIDTIYVNGYGFPAHRGGPMWYADSVGLEKVCERIKVLERDQGFWWSPAPLLRELAGTGKTFADYERRQSK